MENFETKPQMEKIEIVADRKEKEKKPKRRSKSRFFYPDTYYKDKRREEEMKDPDFRAFHRGKW